MRYFHPAALLVIALVLPACDTADESTSPTVQLNKSGKQMATGSGRYSTAFVPAASFEIAAHSDAGGANPHGNAAFSADQDPPFLDFDVRGPVTCLTVVGNRASIGIKVAEGTWGGADISGQGIVLLVQDNGPPGHGVPDVVSNSGFFPNGDAIPCQVFITTQPDRPISSGNIVVK